MLGKVACVILLFLSVIGMGQPDGEFTIKSNFKLDSIYRMDVFKNQIDSRNPANNPYIWLNMPVDFYFSSPRVVHFEFKEANMLFRDSILNIDPKLLILMNSYTGLRVDVEFNEDWSFKHVLNEDVVKDTLKSDRFRALGLDTFIWNDVFDDISSNELMELLFSDFLVYFVEYDTSIREGQEGLGVSRLPSFDNKFLLQHVESKITYSLNRKEKGVSIIKRIDIEPELINSVFKNEDDIIDMLDIKTYMEYSNSTGLIEEYVTLKTAKNRNYSIMNVLRVVVSE